MTPLPDRVIHFAANIVEWSLPQCRPDTLPCVPVGNMQFTLSTMRHKYPELADMEWPVVREIGIKCKLWTIKDDTVFFTAEFVKSVVDTPES